LTKKTRKGDYIKDYAVADFDGDGAHDTVVCTFDDPAEIFIYFQNDKDNWQKKTHTYSNGHEGLDVGDLLRQRKEQQINSPRPKRHRKAPRQNQDSAKYLSLLPNRTTVDII
jgi:hypothetical protein